MLNITEVSVSKSINRTQYRSYRYLDSRSKSVSLLRVLSVLLMVMILAMFLPWTQNIRSKGYVTTLNPYDKPQSVQSLTGGQIEKWYVTEGNVVSIGDTIVVLTEAKEDYLDPNILQNTKEQQNAKESSADAYQSKKSFLEEQKATLGDFQATKLQQLTLKLQQLELKISTVEFKITAAKTNAENALKQYSRMQTMYDQGVKSVTDLETKKMSNQKAIAEVNAVQNELDMLITDRDNIKQERELTQTDYQQKVAKIESEISSVNSYIFSLLGESNKLQSKYNQIQTRQNSFAITSPIDGRVTKMLRNGIGEYLKAQEPIATLVPTEFQKAVELYIPPNDMPLISEGEDVRLQFDGWPAVIFSGWPNNSLGTFSGKIFAIDNEISPNGKYRILITEDNEEKLWPDLIRIGSGTRGLILLNDVKVGYEIWRNLNGFPPDFYTEADSVNIKSKAPLRKLK